MTRFAQLSGMEEATAVGLLIVKLIEGGKFEAAVKFSGSLLSESGLLSNEATVAELIKTMNVTIGNDNDEAQNYAELTSVLVSLGSQLAAFGSEQGLSAFVDLFRWQSAMHSVQENFHVESFRLISCI